MNVALTPDQAKAIASAKGESIRLTDPITKEYYFLIKAVYERLQGIVGDETIYTVAETLDQVMAGDDANDPNLADLQKNTGSFAFPARNLHETNHSETAH